MPFIIAENSEEWAIEAERARDIVNESARFAAVNNDESVRIVRQRRCIEAKRKAKGIASAGEL